MIFQWFSKHIFFWEIQTILDKTDGTLCISEAIYHIFAINPPILIVKRYHTLYTIPPRPRSML